MKIPLHAGLGTDGNAAINCRALNRPAARTSLLLFLILCLFCIFGMDWG